MSDDVQKFEWALKNGDLDQVKALVEKVVLYILL